MAPVIFDPVIGTVQEFINWSLAIVSLMIIWYVVKFFMVAPPTEEEKQKSKEEYDERGAKMREYFSGKMKEREEREKAAKKEKEEQVKKSKELKKKKEKKEKISPAKKSLVEAVEAADKALNLIGKAKTDEDRKELIGLFKEFNESMEKTWKNLSSHRRNLEGEDKKKLKELVDEAEAIQEYVSNNLKKKLPKMSTDFLQKVQSAGIVNEIKKVRGMCHDLWDKMEELHK